MKSRRFLLVLFLCILPVAVFLRVRWWLRMADREAIEEGGLAERNARFYEELWARAELSDPRRFNTWPIVSRFAEGTPDRLEIGPGLRPRLPLAGTHFVDVSASAVARLGEAGGLAQQGLVTELPFAADSFDAICALDIVEHIEDDATAFSEIARVMRPGGHLLLAVPLHGNRWTRFDDFVGHRRRYDPVELEETLRTHGFRIERSAAYGMQPRSPKLAEFGIRCLMHRRGRAMWYYTHIFMPLGLFFQKRLRDEPGLIDLAGVDEVLLVCRKRTA